MLGDELSRLGFKTSNLRAGENYQTCPKCSHLRKKKTLKCLSLKLDDKGATFYCNHCQWAGGVVDRGVVKREGNFKSDFGASARKARYNVLPGS